MSDRSPPTPINISGLTVYPIKSTAGIALSSAWVDDLGLAFDRRFVLSTQQGEFITARTNSKLCLVQASLVQHGLMLTAPNMPNLFIDYRQFVHLDNYQNVEVWSDTISSQCGLAQYDQWFSDYLAKPCQLLYFGEQSVRQVKETEQQTAFADAYPLLLISQASLDALNAKLERPVSMRQFRPNIVVSQAEAFEEDTWQRIRIGDIEFEVTSPCSRCIFTTVDPDTGYKHQEMEPLKTLKSFRQVLNGDVMFGQNLRQLHSQQGQLKLGDEITVLERKTPPRFMVAASSNEAHEVQNKIDSHQEEQTVDGVNKKSSNENKASSKPELQFTSWNKSFVGNNRTTILEQAEEEGMILPYSCRAGMCGRCKVKLDDGDVKVLGDYALSEREKRQGYILACSCIPLTDIVISKP